MPYVNAETHQGTLRGRTVNGVTRFLGVAYGETTGNQHRFLPPIPVQAWTGVRDALEYGPAAPQINPRLSAKGVAADIEWAMHPNGGPARNGAVVSEDCLSLNIWTPSAPTADPRPVIVWLHGGGFTNGSGSETWIDGDVLARSENIVVVTVTHRLGLLGFLDLRAPEVGGIPGSANAGLLDLVESLRWIQKNIARFGGDPNRVTVAGQSGGSGKVAALTAMPAARGLFHRAIMQSGPIRKFVPKAGAEILRDQVFAATGTTTAEQLQKLPIEALLAVQQQVLNESAAQGPAAFTVDTVPGLGPSLDAVDLPNDAFTVQEQVQVPLIIGSTDHEVSLFLANAPFFTTFMSDEEAAAALEMMCPGVGAQAYIAVTSRHPQEAPHLRFARALTTETFEPAITAIARNVQQSGTPVWMYTFGRKTPIFNGLLGASHAVDIPYVFGTFDRVPFAGSEDGQHELASEMMHAWAQFARHGEPETSSPWKSWTERRQTIHRFD